MSWFNSQSRLVQLILLIIPFVNWIVEIFVRVSSLIEKPTTENILGCVLAVFVPVFGWIDLIWVILFNHLCLCK